MHPQATRPPSQLWEGVPGGYCLGSAEKGQERNARYGVRFALSARTRRAIVYYYVCMTDDEITSAYQDAVDAILAKHAEEMRMIEEEAETVISEIAAA